MGEGSVAHNVVYEWDRDRDTATKVTGKQVGTLLAFQLKGRCGGLLRSESSPMNLVSATTTFVAEGQTKRSIILSI